MKPAPFDYVRPASTAEAVNTLAAAGDEGKVIAGGQSLMPLLALRLARPAVLVDLAAIDGLTEIKTVANRVVRCGAMTTHRALTRQQQHPLLAAAAEWIGHDAIRTRGTLGGSLAHADPAAELPLVACATGGSMTIEGPAGRRTVAADDFFVGPLQSSLGDHDVLVSTDLPVPDRWGFAEIARRHGDFGLVTVVAAELAGRWRIVIGGVAGVPHRAFEAEAVLNAGTLTAKTAAQASSAAVIDVQPFDDIHATAAYRRGLTEQLTFQALANALDQTGETIA